MKSKRTAAGVLWSALWAALIVAHIATAAPRVIRAIAFGSLGKAGPYYSTDIYLTSFLRAEHSSMRIVEVMSSLPQGKPVLVLIPGPGTQSAFVAAILNYLGWPREVQTMEVPQDEVEQRIQRIHPHDLAAIGFIDLDPPTWLPKGVRIGHRAVVIPLSDPTPR